MIAKRPTKGDFAWVVEHLSAHSAREVFSCRPESFTRAALYVEMCSLSAIALDQWAFFPDDNGPPAGIFAVYPNGPGLASFRTLTTDQWPRIAGKVPRFIQRRVRPYIRGLGIHMAEFSVLADPPPNFKWFALMGARPWGAPLPRGRDREPYVTMACVEPAWLATIDGGKAPVSSPTEAEG